MGRSILLAASSVFEHITAVLPPSLNLSVTPQLQGDGFYYAYDSENSDYLWKLLNPSDLSWTAQEIADRFDTTNETIDFLNGYSAEHQSWIAPQGEEWLFTFVRDVELGISQQTISVHHKVDDTADVYYDGVLTAENTGLLMSPTQELFRLDEYTHLTWVPNIPTVEITMTDYDLTVGETADVIFTFNTVPVNFGLENVTQENGSCVTLPQGDAPNISNLRFTPDEEINDTTNVITVVGSSGQIEDKYGNATNANFTSTNYSVYTVTTTSTYNIRVDFRYQAAIPANYSAYTNTFDAIATYQATVLKDDTETITGCTLAIPNIFNAGTSNYYSAANSVFDSEQSLQGQRVYGDDRTVEIYLEAGTYTITPAAYSQQNATTDFVLDGVTKSVVTSTDDIIFDDTHNAEFTNIVSTGETFVLQVNRGSGSDRAFLTSLYIQKVT